MENFNKLIQAQFNKMCKTGKLPHNQILPDNLIEVKI